MESQNLINKLPIHARSTSLTKSDAQQFHLNTFCHTNRKQLKFDLDGEYVHKQIPQTSIVLDPSITTKKSIARYIFQHSPHPWLGPLFSPYAKSKSIKMCRERGHAYWPFLPFDSRPLEGGEFFITERCGGGGSLCSAGSLGRGGATPYIVLHTFAIV